MNSLRLDYSDLSAAALVRICQLADLLTVPPQRAAEMYLAARAERPVAGGGEPPPRVPTRRGAPGNPSRPAPRANRRRQP